MSVSDVTLRRGEGGCGGAAAATGINYGLRQPLTARDKPAEPMRLPDRIAQTEAQPDIYLRVHDDLDEVCREWRSFEQHADHTVFQSIDWLANWQRHIGALQKLVPAIVIGREADGEILFILPLAVEALGPIQRLTWLGSRLCDYNAPLLAERFSAHVSVERFMLAWRDIIRLLRSDPRFRFDLIDLQKMPECVGAQRNPFLDLDVRVHPSGAYAAALGADWDAFYAAKRSSSTRKRERRQLRQLADHGAVSFTEIEDCEERARTLSTLFEQKSRILARMGIDSPFFLLPGRREFFLALVNDLALRGCIHVSRLTVGAQVAAASIGLKHRGCYYLIMSSYDAGELSRFGPGRAHLHELLRHAIGEGLQRFDFTVGDEPYKRDWSDLELRLHDYLKATTLRGWGMKLLMVQYRRLKRCIKQSPGLWRAFRKARALAGAITASRP